MYTVLFSILSQIASFSMLECHVTSFLDLLEVVFFPPNNLLLKLI